MTIFSLSHWNHVMSHQREHSNLPTHHIICPVNICLDDIPDCFRAGHLVNEQRPVQLRIRGVYRVGGHGHPATLYTCRVSMGELPKSSALRTDHALFYVCLVGSHMRRPRQRPALGGIFVGAIRGQDSELIGGTCSRGRAPGNRGFLRVYDVERDLRASLSVPL